MKQPNHQLPKPEALRQAYGSVPAAVESRTLQTLAALPEAEPAAFSRGKRRVAALVLALSLLAVSAAVAIGLRAALTQQLGLPEAADALVRTPDPAAASAVTGMAVFTVDSYLFDGISLMADIRVEPTREGIWVLPYLQEADLDWDASNLNPDAAGMSIREYAASIGIRQIRQLQITDAGPSRLVLQAQPFLGSDGLIHILLTSSLLGEDRQEVEVRFAVLFSAQPREATLRLPRTADAPPQRQDAPVTIEALGVTVSQIEIIRTGAAVYCRMPCAWQDAEGRLPYVAPVFLDAGGAPIDTALWAGIAWDTRTRTGCVQGMLPPAAVTNGRFTFRLRVDRQLSDPITVALPPE